MKLKSKIIKTICIILSLIILLTVTFAVYETSLSGKYYDLIKNECDKYGLNHVTVISLIKAESNFNKNAKSNKNAVGLMQIKEETANYVSKMYDIKYDDLFDDNSNIKLGVAYLDYLTKKFVYEDLVLCSYNAGEGTVLRWMQRGYIVKGNINYIPYKETRNYLTKIKKLKRFYSIFY